MRLLAGHTDRVRRLSYSPDGRALASLSKDGTVRVWDVTEGREVGRWTADGEGSTVVFADHGRCLAWPATSGVVQLWDWAANSRIGELSSRPTAWAQTVIAANGMGQTLVGAQSVGGWSIVIRWNVVTLASAEVIQQKVEVGCIALSSDEMLLATGPRRDTGRERAVRLWRWRTRALPAVLPHPDRVQDLAFTSDGKTLAVATGADVWLWDTASHELVGTLPGLTKQANALSFSPDGRLLAVANNHRRVQVWDVASRRERVAMDWGIDRVRSVAFAPDGMTCAAGGEDGKIVIWDVADL